jgi:hypothetical protein
MAHHIKSIDIGDAPELLRLAEEVQRSHEACLLRRAGEDLALVVPVPRPASRRRTSLEKTQADYEAFRSAAGGWKDLDTDKLIEDIYESRGIYSRTRRAVRYPVDA